MEYLPHEESHSSFNSSLSLFNAENVGVSVKHGYCEQLYQQQPLLNTYIFKFIPVKIIS